MPNNDYQRLRNCPFCGGEAKIKRGMPKQQRNDCKQAFIQCRRCGAKTKTLYSLAFQSWRDVETCAIKNWNRRADNETD